MAGLIVILATVFDFYVGEPRRYHPLVGFGRLATFIETKFNRGKNRWRGFVAWSIAVLPFVVLAAWLPQNILFDGFILYWAIGFNSLKLHAQAVLEPLLAGDIVLARQQVSRIVSRDTADLDASGVAKATVESVLENGSDAIFAPIFWYLILGAPAVVLYRLANTLDAMWAYKTERLIHFGYASAKIDDFLNFIPARLVALSYAILGDFLNATRSWFSQSQLCDSPNAGPVMASGAGALGIRLGGAYRSKGVDKCKPELGCGRDIKPSDITRALDLVSNSLILWCLVAVLISV